MKQNKEISKNKGWNYMQELAQNNELIENHTLYTPIPHKISRCLNLGSTPKIILFDLVSYMGNKYYSYPSIDDIALNCGMSHVTVQANMKELEAKKFLIVKRRRNNTYYLPDGLELNPYILLSEVLHGFRGTISKTGLLSDRQSNEFIRSILKSNIYIEKLNLLCKEYKSYLGMQQFYNNINGLTIFQEILGQFSEAVTEEFNREYPEIVL
ncbi:helix-turn-helix domain-containing protein [Tepidibacter mesophilus]|uniref:helix-turn-helix domain-containing protein n=1 Tax=Tepidibacter mesophilus TaxID=655607 RepID=UPI000C075213|nr:helix-turn-helix domain-containing protein [Tepidibacter mesophilus]